MTFFHSQAMAIFNKFNPGQDSCTCCGSICPWFKFYFPLFWDMVMYDDEFDTKENKI